MSDLLIIIVLYNIKINNIEYLKCLEDYDILIYDNSKDSQISLKYHYIHDPTNPGVSKAYNNGIILAKRLNKKRVLILDQDTKFNKAILDQYDLLFNHYGEDYLYAPIITGNNKIYSPYKEQAFRNKYQTNEEFKYSEQYSLQKKSVINSGLMIPISLFDRIGGFNENIKLDFSDSCFIEKYKRINNIVIMANIYLEHSLSGDEGKDKMRELSRFEYYCSGAKYYYKDTKDKNRLRCLLLFRTIKLIIKYKTIYPIITLKKIIFGNIKTT